MLGDQLGLFGEIAPKKVSLRAGSLLVQDARGSERYVLVDVDAGTCECAERQCGHLEYAADVLKPGCGTAKYMMKSSFHKELRRGDYAAAMHWATWMAKAYGKSSAIEYMRKIWSEETCNFDLAVRLHQSLTKFTLADAVQWFCSSSKIWERYDLWPIWVMNGTNVSTGGVEYELGRHQQAHVVDVIERRDIDEWCVIATMLSPEPRWAELKQFREDTLAWLVRIGALDEDVAVVFRTRYHSRRFESEDQMLAAVVGGVLGPRGDVRYDAIDCAVEHSLVDCSRVQRAKLYSYDYHTVLGERFMKGWHRKHPGVKIRMGVDTSPVDLRWCGGLLPLFWRFSAFRQTGQTAWMDKMKWHEIEPDPADWAAMQRWCPKDWWPDVA